MNDPKPKPGGKVQSRTGCDHGGYRAFCCADTFVAEQDSEATHHPVWVPSRRRRPPILELGSDGEKWPRQATTVTKQRWLKSRVGKPFKEMAPNWNTIKVLKGRSRAHFRREALGLF